MGTRRAVRQDLIDLIKYVNEDYSNNSKLDKLPFKLYHEGCKSGRIKCPNGVNLTCNKCKSSWGKDRPNTWTDEEISKKFWCELPVDKQLYKLVHNGAHTSLVPVHVPKEEPKNEKKKSDDPLLDKLNDALGKKRMVVPPNWPFSNP